MGIFDMNCHQCGRKFGSVMARKAHERDKHGGRDTAAVMVEEEVGDDTTRVSFVGTRDEKYMHDTRKERVSVLMRVDADTDRLYHRDINVTIAYMEEMRDRFAEFGGVSLDMHVTGYETWEMVFEYHRAETDEEYEWRQESIADRKRIAAEEAAREKARQGRLKQWESLNREFGRRY
jgi:hypothetical protein